MYTFLIVLIALIALLLMLVVLVQSGKGGGLAGIAAGGQATQILGARQAPDLLEKATWTLATAFIVLCIITTFFTGTSEARRSVIEDRPAPAQGPVPSEEPLEGGEAPAVPSTPGPQPEAGAGDAAPEE